MCFVLSLRTGTNATNFVLGQTGPQNNNVFAANAVSGAGPTGLADSENVSCNTSSTPLLSSVGDDMGHEEKHSDVLAEVVGGETPDAPPRRRNIARVIATTTVLAVGGDAAEVGEADASAQVLDTARPHGVPMEAQLKVAMYDLLDHEDRAVLQFSGGERCVFPFAESPFCGVLTFQSSFTLRGRLVSVQLVDMGA